MREASDREEYLDIKEWIEKEAPDEKEGEENFDHIPNLLKQLSREPRERPEMHLPQKSIDELEYKDFQLEGYDPHGGLEFSVAE